MRFLLIIVITFLNIAYSDNDSTPLYSYKGGWPVNPKSNEIEDPGFDLPCPGGAGCECKTNKDCDNQNCQAHPKGNYCLPKKGDLIPRFEAIDQFGESVDLYDFANQGKMILIELSAVWCSPCNDLANWLVKNDQKIRENRWWKDRYLPIREMIQNNEIFPFLFDAFFLPLAFSVIPNSPLVSAIVTRHRTGNASIPMDGFYIMPHAQLCSHLELSPSPAPTRLSRPRYCRAASVASCAARSC